jgi:hypothetical protein
MEEGMRANHDWRPCTSEARSLQHRMFTFGKEKEISDFIVTSDCLAAIVRRGRDFPSLIMTTFLEKYGNMPSIPAFKAFDGFVRHFKVRNGFSSRPGHSKRRPNVNPEEQKEFERVLRSLLSDEVPRGRILNVDETAWRSYPTSLHDLGEKSQQPFKSGFTVMLKKKVN